MAVSILDSIINISKHESVSMAKIETGSGNRITKIGDSLEYYFRDSFCNSFDIETKENKDEKHEEIFSYIGNPKDPPDAMIKGGDALEFKKMGIGNSDIQLNSSFPRDKLYSTDPKINERCRSCENWTEKDMIYCLGFSLKSKIKILLFLHGGCVAADKEIYETLQNAVTSSITRDSDSTSETRELARFNKVDSLGYTSLRVRGMWLLKNPLNTFSDTLTFSKEDGKTYVFALMTKEKYLGFEEAKRKVIESSIGISDVKIKNPNDPKEETDSILIKFSF